jgi:aconitase A
MASPSQLRVGDRSYEIYRLDELQARYDIARLPYTLRVLLENVLRNGDEADVEAVARWNAKADPSDEISPSSTSPPCETRWPTSAAIPLGSTR